jgi:hypothetical protein
MQPLLCLLLCFSVSPSTPATLEAEARPAVVQPAGPLRAQVKATRSGRLLQLDYRLLDAAGQRFFERKRGKPPEFSLLLDGREIGSGAFEYG